MKHLCILLLAVSAFAQGTNVPGPLNVTPPVPATMQSGIIFVDLSQPNAQPTSKQYILSIVNGTIQESDNGGAYRLPGVGVGNTLTLTITCPKGKGTIQSGWVTQNCTAKITGVQ